MLSHQHNLVNLLLGQVSIPKHLLDWFESSPEEIHVELLELGPGQSLGEVLALEQGLDLHTDLQCYTVFQSSSIKHAIVGLIINLGQNHC